MSDSSASSNVPAHVRLNEREIAAKVIDGEAIIINLAKGTYYSLEQVGGAAWSLLVAGRSVDDTAQTLAAHYQVDASTVAADLRALVADLLEHNLVVPAEAGASNGEAADVELPTAEAYSAPVLNAYSDMEDVLALDPPLPEVEVEEEPWTANQ
ncbi:MAG: PqqD family protein [Phycisphaeraceae bacterium]